MSHIKYAIRITFVASTKYALRTTTRSMTHQHPRSTSRRRVSRLCAYVWYRRELNEPAIDTVWFIACRGSYSRNEGIDHIPLESGKCTGVITVSRGWGSYFCVAVVMSCGCCSALGNKRKTHYNEGCDLWMRRSAWIVMSGFLIGRFVMIPYRTSLMVDACFESLLSRVIFCLLMKH